MKGGIEIGQPVLIRAIRVICGQRVNEPTKLTAQEPPQE